MKRFYYNVKQFNPESEGELALEQYNNDDEFIHTVFHEYKLHPKYSEKERFEDGMNYIGHLEFQLYNWKGNKIDWLEHTIELFNNEYRILNKPGLLPKENFKDLEDVLNYLNEHLVIYNNKQLNENSFQDFERIKWLGSPSQFGYLFSELVSKGFIDLPISKGKGSFAKLAQNCFKVFEINCAPGTLVKELSLTSNSLQDHNRKEFKIPVIKDLY